MRPLVAGVAASYPAFVVCCRLRRADTQSSTWLSSSPPETKTTLLLVQVQNSDMFDIELSIC